MSYTGATNYSGYIQNLLKTAGRNAKWIYDLVNNGAVRGMGGAGVISVPVLARDTPASLTDGTMLTSVFNNTYVALTAYDRSYPVKMKRSQISSAEWTPQNMAAIDEGAANAMRELIAAQVIADLVAGTPGKSVTLATGKVDFAAAGSTELGKLDACIAYVVANTAVPMDQLMILMPSVAYGNFNAARNATVGSSFALNGDSVLTYQGIPIYPVDATSTNWGTATKECAYVLAPNAYSLALVDAAPHWNDGQFWHPFEDGLFGHTIDMSWHGGVTLAGAYAAVVNPSS